MLLASIALGVIGPALAALPAVRRAARLPLAETLQAAGSASGPEGRMEQLLRRVRLLPRTAQIGLRDVARRRRRGISTVLQVGLAVATLLGVPVAGNQRGQHREPVLELLPHDIDAGSSRGGRSRQPLGR